MVNRLSDLIIGHYERHAAAWDADRANCAWNDKPSDKPGTIALWQCCPKARASSISAAVPVRRSRVTWLRRGSRSRASIHRRHSSRFVEAACPITSGSLAICAGYRWGGHSMAFWPGTAFSTSTTTISEICLTSLPGTPDRPRC
jgi:hypothetical protein